MKHEYCILMAGGGGTGLWPVSRAKCPKQFIDLGNGGSFIRNTYDRFAEFMPHENILVAAPAKYKALIHEQLPELAEENIIVEPYIRNTAPCILYSAFKLLKRDPDAVMVVSPADHRITGKEEFRKSILAALEYAGGGDNLMTLGVKPLRPDANYGYIQVEGGKVDSTDRIFKVKTFIEKPDGTLAKVLVNSGEFFWNSGIFVWRAATILAEMEKYMPGVTALFRGWEKAIDTKAEKEFIARAYAECTNISIDYGVMEKTDKAWLWPASFSWVDVGSWESLMEVWDKKDEAGNGIRANRAILKETRDSALFSTHKNKLTAIRGLEDYVVVDTKDVLLICPKRDFYVKDFITNLTSPGLEKYK
ncbi:MAG: mannose-1-phosphate guanylyltransferase [Bacteroidales bacterium]|nr:mannose-1-phosphate guanylyltransferase [Bacteroidales bacterium]